MKPIEITTGGRSLVCFGCRSERYRYRGGGEVQQADGDSWTTLARVRASYFVQTQQKCDTILKDLMLASYSVMSLHGGMSGIVE